MSRHRSLVGVIAHVDAKPGEEGGIGAGDRGDPPSILAAQVGSDRIQGLGSHRTGVLDDRLGFGDFNGDEAPVGLEHRHLIGRAALLEVGENPGDPFKAWDFSQTFDYMPKQWITFRIEGDYRHANVPYWSGSGGVTPPPGVNNGFPSQYACMDGTPSSTSTGCGNDGGLWTPDLKKNEWLMDIDLMVKF